MWLKLTKKVKRKSQFPIQKNTFSSIVNKKVQNNSEKMQREKKREHLLAERAGRGGGGGGGGRRSTRRSTNENKKCMEKVRGFQSFHGDAEEREGRKVIKRRIKNATM